MSYHYSHAHYFIEWHDDRTGETYSDPTPFTSFDHAARMADQSAMEHESFAIIEVDRSDFYCAASVREHTAR